MNKFPMTLSGEAALREELERLKKIERPRITKAIAEAREHGDLKENAEYHAAREQQSFNEGRIMEIEGKLGNANFVANAPAEVVAQERQRIVDWNTQLGALREQAGKLGG